jgi:hypothetical protein
MSESDAYAAGLFDGEGHIAIVFSKGSGEGKDKYPRFFLQVSMSQNSKEAVEWLSENYGGSIRFVKGKRSYDRGTYQRWNWSLSTNQAALFLKTIFPYTLIKSDEIKIAIEFQETMDPTRGRGRTPAQIIEFRRDCFDRIRACRKEKVA